MIFSFLLLAAFYFDWVPGFAPGFSGQRGGKGSNPRINAGKSRPGQTFSLDSKWMLNHKFELGGMALLLLGLLLGFKAQWMVMGSMEMPGLKLWGFYGLAAALFTTGIFLQGLGRKPKGQTVSRSQEEPKPLASIVEWSAFGLIMVFAAFLRIYRLDSIPSGIFIDQGMEGWAALRIFHNQDHFLPVWEFDVFQNPALLLYQIGVWLEAWLVFFKLSQFGFYLFFVLLSLATLLLVYWTSRQIGGQRLALSGLFILAVMHWNMNFSRNGFPTIQVPFYTFGTLAFLLYALKPSKNAWPFYGAAIAVGFFYVLGVLPFFCLAFNSIVGSMHVFAALFVSALLLTALGYAVYLTVSVKNRVPYFSMAIAATFFAVGLYTYQAYKIVPLLILLFALYEIATNWKGVLAVGKPLVVFCIVFLVQAFPFLKHTYDLRGIGGRENDLMIMGRVHQEHSWQPLINNIIRTANMFNWRGDNMSRHNLQDYRMLDDITGVLFIFGLVGAIFFLRKKAYFYGLVGILVMSVPCVLSIDAAHANRMLGTTPFIALLAALPLVALWKRVHGFWGDMGDAFFPVFLLVPFYFMTFQNYDAYFNKMAKSLPSWSEYAVRETTVGKAITRYGDAYDYFISPELYNYYTIEFLGYFHKSRMYPLELPDNLISHVGDTSRGLYFALAEGRVGLLDTLKYFYPAGQAEYLVDPAGNSVEYFYRVPAEEVAKVRGLVAHFDRLVGGKTEQHIAQFPLGLPLGPYHAILTGNLYVSQTGNYKWEIKGNGRAVIKVKGKANPAGFHHLEKGEHPVEVVLDVPEGEVLPLVIQQVGQKGVPLSLDAGYFDNLPAPRGLKGSYYHDMDMREEPFLIQWDPVINYTNGNDFPAVTPYAIHWSGTLRVDKTGQYQFAFKTLDRAKLKIDGKEWNLPGLIQNRGGFLTQGVHSIDVIYLKPVSGWSALTFTWMPPGEKMEVVPTSAFGEVP